MKRDRQHGFSIIESAIVVVLIGLFIAVVLSGRSLLRATELRSVISDVHEFISATNGFFVKYGSLPGDFENAQAFWPNCVDMAINTCNGDGDGKISPAETEGLRAWQHLSLAGFMSQEYSGVLDEAQVMSMNWPPDSGLEWSSFLAFTPNAYAMGGGINPHNWEEELCYKGETIEVPSEDKNSYITAGAIEGPCPEITGKFAVNFNVPRSSVSEIAGYKFDAGIENRITLASENPPNLDGAVISPEEALTIDSKMDDGVANEGDVIGADGMGKTGCEDGSGSYMTSSSEQLCILLFSL